MHRARGRVASLAPLRVSPSSSRIWQLDVGCSSRASRASTVIAQPLFSPARGFPIKAARNRVRVSSLSLVSRRNLCSVQPVKQPLPAPPLPVAPQSLLGRVGEQCLMYMELSKFRLSSLVIVTTMVGYYMAPTASFDITQFLYASLGTTLAIGSANSFNQVIEHKLDLQMDRTMSRMLPSGKMSRFHALSFGFITGALGCSVLFSQVNPTAGFLAFGNIILYALIYTPLKQKHPINTWVGAIVGAIPPLIGWTAATGGEIDAGGYVLGSLLFLWQIPHFMSLSYMLKDDYRKASYKMLSVTKESAVAKTALLWTLPLLGIGAASAATGMTSWWFALDSLPVGCYLLWLANNFYKTTDMPNAKKCFLGSIRYLPVLMLLMMIHKTNKPQPAAEIDSSSSSTTSSTTTLVSDIQPEKR